MGAKLTVPPGYVLIFRTYYLDKDGNRVYAKSYGYKAWPLVIPIRK